MIGISCALLRVPEVMGDEFRAAAPRAPARAAIVRWPPFPRLRDRRGPRSALRSVLSPMPSIDQMAQRLDVLVGQQLGRARRGARSAARRRWCRSSSARASTPESFLAIGLFLDERDTCVSRFEELPEGSSGGIFRRKPGSRSACPSACQRNPATVVCFPPLNAATALSRSEKTRRTVTQRRKVTQVRID